MTDKTVEMELEDLMDGRRKFEIEFDDGEVKEYFISTPTADVIRSADWEYAKTYNRALKEGVFTSSEMLEILQARNIVGPDYDKASEEKKVKLAEKIISMERETDRDKRFALALEVANLREDVFQWNQRMTGPMASTCEEIANHVRIEYLTASILEDKDSNRIWDTFEDYRNEKDIALQAKARLEVMLWVEGLDSDFFDRVPENVIIRDVVNKLKEDAEAEAEDEAEDGAGESSEEASAADEESKDEEPVKEDSGNKELSSTKDEALELEAPKKPAKKKAKKKPGRKKKVTEDSPSK